MTASATVEGLPQWPYIVRMSPCLVMIDGRPPDAFMHYAAPGERAYVSAEALDAAMARLRLAVEALQIARDPSTAPFLGHDRFVSWSVAVYVDRILAAIGPLPDAPPCAKEKP